MWRDALACDRAGTTVSDIYDALAPHYREYARSRQAYLAAVDRFILRARARRRVEAVLDVGAGDGVRGMALARRLAARRVVLCEPSREMAARCRELGADAVWEVPAEQLPQSESSVRRHPVPVERPRTPARPPGAPRPR